MACRLDGSPLLHTLITPVSVTWPQCSMPACAVGCSLHMWGRWSTQQCLGCIGSHCSWRKFKWQYTSSSQCEILTCGPGEEELKEWALSAHTHKDYGGSFPVLLANYTCCFELGESSLWDLAAVQMPSPVQPKATALSVCRRRSTTALSLFSNRFHVTLEIQPLQSPRAEMLTTLFSGFNLTTSF